MYFNAQYALDWMRDLIYIQIDRISLGIKYLLRFGLTSVTRHFINFCYVQIFLKRIYVIQY